MVWECVGYVECRVWYILESIVIISIVVVFGFYAGLYVKGTSKCEWKDLNKTKVMIVGIIGGVLVVLGMVIWGVIVRIIMNRNLYEEKE